MMLRIEYRKKICSCYAIIKVCGLGLTATLILLPGCSSSAIATPPSKLNPPSNPILHSIGNKTIKETFHNVVLFIILRIIGAQSIGDNLTVKAGDIKGKKVEAFVQENDGGTSKLELY